MPPDSKDSGDESNGETCSHPILNTPMTSKPDAEIDDEKALVRASAKFGSLKDPFAETPDIPQSIPPNAFSHRAAGFVHPTPSRPQNSYNRFANNQPTGRFRSNTTFDKPAPRFRHGMNSASFNSYSTSDPERFGYQHVFSSIMTATQYVNVSPGLSGQTQLQLTRLLQDISQGFGIASAHMRKQLDDANRGKEEEHERYKRAMHEVNHLRKSVDKLEALNKSIVPQFEHVVERENLLKAHVSDLQQQLRESHEQIKTLTADAFRFRSYHDKTIESEAKALRAKTPEIEEHGFLSPVHPASVNNVPDGNSDCNSPITESQRTPTSVQTARARVIHWKENLDDGDQNATKGIFIPNPEAKAWSPKKLEASSAYSSQSEAEVQAESVSGLSAEVIVYRGRGASFSNLKAMTPYLSPPDHGGGATAFIRTPFGIVFGEFPTVEENSRLPGDKMIPREKDEWDSIDIRRALAYLYDLCKGYVANCHLKTAPVVAYAKLKDQESYTWHYLMEQVYKDPVHAANHLTYLLNTKAFVPYLLQRACVDYLLKKILTPTLFLGFSEKMDGHLRALQSQLANIADSRDRNVYNRNRQRIIEDHATLIKHMATSPEWPDFRRQTVDRHSHVLWALLEPCRAQGTPVEVAHKSLRVMVAACWDISMKIWSSGQTLHYFFPECASKFSPSTMEALNGHHMASSPEELVNSQCRISLVVTPTMTLRDDRNSERMQCLAAHKAQVLVMK